MKTERGRENRYLLQHKQFVARGLFEAIPQTEIKVGQAVTIRHNPKLYEVFEVDEELGMAIVGYNREGKRAWLALALEDVRDAEKYANALAKFLGRGKEVQISLQLKESGAVMRFGNKPRLN